MMSYLEEKKNGKYVRQNISSYVEKVSNLYENH